MDKTIQGYFKLIWGLELTSEMLEELKVLGIENVKISYKLASDFSKKHGGLCIKE